MPNQGPPPGNQPPPGPPPGVMGVSLLLIISDLSFWLQLLFMHYVSDFAHLFPSSREWPPHQHQEECRNTELHPLHLSLPTVNKTLSEAERCEYDSELFSTNILLGACLSALELLSFLLGACFGPSSSSPLTVLAQAMLFGIFTPIE